MLTVSDNHIVLGGGGGGDVVGASSTDNAVARFDGTTGKQLQDSGVTIDDSGNIIMGNGSGLVGKRVDGVAVTMQAITPADNFNSMYSSGGTYGIKFKSTASSTLVTVLNGGNVCIGAVSPTAKLDVDGTSRFRGSATFNGQIIDNAGSSGADGQVLKKVGGLVIWANP